MRRVDSLPLFGSCFLMVFAMLAPSLRSQTLDSEADWKAVLKAVSKDSNRIKTVKAQLRDVNEQGEQLARDEESLNSGSCSDAQRSGCPNPSGDEQMIEQKKQALLQEWQVDEQQLRSLEDRVNEHLAKIRVAKVLPGHEAWTQSIKKCATLPPIDAVGCLGKLRPDRP